MALIISLGSQAMQCRLRATESACWPPPHCSIHHRAVGVHSPFRAVCKPVICVANPRSIPVLSCLSQNARRCDELSRGAKANEKTFRTCPTAKSYRSKRVHRVRGGRFHLIKTFEPQQVKNPDDRVLLVTIITTLSRQSPCQGHRCNICYCCRPPSHVKLRLLPSILIHPYP